MTICPNCGKEYRITPDVCGECGTPLTVSDIADPFAEAVKEEAGLREKALQRRAEQTADIKTALFTEETDGSDESTESAEEGKPKRKKLRVLAVTAALAVAAGGGWLGWKHFKGKDRSIGADVCFMDGNQPYFYDGQTGILHKLGDPIDAERLSLGAYWQSSFWDETMVSADHTRILFPKYVEKEQNEYEFAMTHTLTWRIPCSLDLTGKDPEQDKPVPLISNTADLDKNDTIITSAMLNRAGDRVLLLKSSVDLELLNSTNDYQSAYSDEYIVWQDPSRYDTELVPLDEMEVDLEVLEKAGDGTSFLLHISSAPEGEDAPVHINSPGDVTGYRYSLLRQNPDGTAGDPIVSDIQWMHLNTFRSYSSWSINSVNMRYENAAEKPRYLFYFCGREYDHIPEELEGSYILERGGVEIAIKDGKVLNALSHSDDSLDGPVTLSQSAAEEAAGKMMESGRFLVGTEVHRFDLQTGEDLTVAYEAGSSDSVAWNGLLDGNVLRSEFGEENAKMTIYLYENGEFEPEDIEADMTEYGPDFNLINNSADLYYVCRSGVPYLYVKGEPHKLVLDENTDLSLKDAALSASGSRVLLYMGSKLDGTSMFVCSVDGLSEGSEIVCEAIGEGRDSFFCGDHLITYLGNTVNVGTNVLSADGSVITSAATGNLYADANAGVLYFTERGDNGIAFCRWKDGVTDVIAERTAYAPDGESVQYNTETGCFAVVVPEPDSNGNPDKTYSIYTGDAGSGSLEECKKIWNGTENPVLGFPSRMFTGDYIVG